MGFWDGSGISWTICKQSAPRSRQITIQHHITQFLQARFSYCCPTNSVKELKACTDNKFNNVWLFRHRQLWNQRGVRVLN